VGAFDFAAKSTLNSQALPWAMAHAPVASQ